jgi:hypothetical protein
MGQQRRTYTDDFKDAAVPIAYPKSFKGLNSKTGSRNHKKPLNQAVTNFWA